MANRDEILSVLKMLSAAFPQNLSEDKAHLLIDLWVGKFAGVAADELKAAALAYMDHGTYFPKISEIWRELSALRGGNADAVADFRGYTGGKHGENINRPSTYEPSDKMIAYLLRIA